MVVGDGLFAALEADGDRLGKNVEQQLLRAAFGGVALGAEVGKAHKGQRSDPGDVQGEEGEARNIRKRLHPDGDRGIEYGGQDKVSGEGSEPDQSLSSRSEK